MTVQFCDRGFACAALILAAACAAPAAPRPTPARSQPAGIARAGVTPQDAPVLSSRTVAARYVGSRVCGGCHSAIYERWKKTPMANVVRDPREHPDAITPDLSTNPFQKFERADVALVYGSRWKQRYFTKVGNDYFVQPAQWDVTHRVWRKYFVESGNDWWATLYPPDNT